MYFRISIGSLINVLLFKRCLKQHMRTRELEKKGFHRKLQSIHHISFPLKRPHLLESD